MKIFRNAITATALIAAFVLSTAVVSEAQRRSDREVRDAVRSLNSNLEDFEYNLREQMRSSSANREDLAVVSDDLRRMRGTITEFETNLQRRRDNRDDVNKIIDAARRVDAFLNTNPQNRRVEDEWQEVRTQLDRLGSNYGIIANWDSDNEPQWNPNDREPYEPGPVDNSFPSPSNTINVGLSGTYELDRTRSENVNEVVTDFNLGTEERDDLMDRLTAPEQISIDIRGNQVTLTTSNAAPVNFIADGRDKTETTAAGRTIRVRATLRGEILTVSSLGGESDYTITFTSVSNGRGLKVSRRVTTEYLSSTVFAESVYNKTDIVASTGIGGGTVDNSYDPDGTYSDNDQPNTIPYGNRPAGNQPGRVTGTPGNFVVPNGTIVSGTLENEINTKVSQNNDRFRLTVQSPVDFRGAVVEGYISGVGRSGKVTGQSNVTFNFQKITLRNGQTYDFAGYLQGITDQNGRTVRVDNEGTVRGDSQTRETAKRGGIGAALGAVIGAIAGGGKGAAIGAVIGGGAGAGSVAVQGKEDIELQQGSVITITSSSPAQRYRQPDR